MIEEEDSLLEKDETHFSVHSPKVQKAMAEEAAQRQRTWSYYQAMKAKQPDKYWLPSIQKQMHDDAFNLQDAFIDGDFLNE